MLRTLIGLLVIVIVAFLVLGYVRGWNAGDWLNRGGVETQSREAVDRARERAAEIGRKAAAVAGDNVKTALNEAALTSKIKAKMALDDSVKARAIDVTTRGTIVTLSGTVESVSERDRALSLARETEGVTQVIDDLRMTGTTGGAPRK